MLRCAALCCAVLCCAVLRLIALLDQQALDVQFPIINARNMSAVVGTPLAQGRLAGGNFYGQEDNTPTALKVQEIKHICESYNVDIVRINRMYRSCVHVVQHQLSSDASDCLQKAAALQFPPAHPRVASIIPGSANAEEAAENKAMLDTLLPKGLWRKFKEAGVVRGDAPVPGDAEAAM